MSALTVVARLADALARRDLDAVAGVFAPDATVSCGDVPGAPWSGLTDPVAFYRALLDAVELDVAREAVVGRDDEIVVLGRTHGRVRRTGRHYRTAFAVHVRCDGTRITGYRLYEDTAAVAAAFTTDRSALG